MGDRIFEINGQALRGGSAQAARMLHRAIGRFEFKVSFRPSRASNPLLPISRPG